jgi:hypothetical protein
MKTLPEIVATTTRQAFPKKLEMLDKAAYSWLDFHDLMPHGSPMRQQCLAALETFEAATFNALHGWYRPAAIMLRCMLEDTLVGLYYQRDQHLWPEFAKIIAGDKKSPKFWEIRNKLEVISAEAKRLLRDANDLHDAQLSALRASLNKRRRDLVFERSDLRFRSV